MTVQPSLAPLKKVVRLLEESGIPYALGGSGLLYSYGLIDTVHDWDLTTDASFEDVSNALHGVTIQVSPSGDGPFASSYRLCLNQEGTPIDLIGKFSICTEAGICHLPAIPTSFYHGIQVGSPEVWFVAYSLMQRKEKSQILWSFLRQRGVNPDIIRLLCKEPLPSVLQCDLLNFPQKKDVISC